MPKPPPSPATTPALADRHETLHLRAAALLRQAEAVAARRPAEPVPDAVRRVAEDLLFEARAFEPRGRRSLPPAAPAYAGLAVQLGQVLAVLGAWEARHTTWSAPAHGFAWRLTEGETRPVRRLLSPPRTGATPPSAPPAPRENMAALRSKLARRIEQLAARQPSAPPAE